MRALLLWQKTGSPQLALSVHCSSAVGMHSSCYWGHIPRASHSPPVSGSSWKQDHQALPPAAVLGLEPAHPSVPWIRLWLTLHLPPAPLSVGWPTGRERPRSWYWGSQLVGRTCLVLLHLLGGVCWFFSASQPAHSRFRGLMYHHLTKDFFGISWLLKYLDHSGRISGWKRVRQCHPLHL